MTDPTIDPEVPQPPAPSAVPDAAPAFTAPPGYEVMGELVRGGTGVVYEARGVVEGRKEQ